MSIVRRGPWQEPREGTKYLIMGLAQEIPENELSSLSGWGAVQKTPGREID